jgi:hypothetical protein
MAFTPLERDHVRQGMEAFLKRRRPPPAIRDQLDIGYRIADQSVEIFEIRPDWRGSGGTNETHVAKTTYVRTDDRWKVFWMRRDLRWHGYEPAREVDSLDAVLRVVERDDQGCFWG